MSIALTVEIAFDSGYTTAATSRTWTDVSSYVEAQDGLSWSLGRQDEHSTAQPGRLSLTLNNTDGRFTPGYTSGAYYPNVLLGRPVRVRSTFNSWTYSEWLGYVDSWPVSWPGGTDAHSTVTITAATRMARMGNGATLRSIIEETMAPYSPAAYFTMGDPAGSTQAADSSGNGYGPFPQSAPGRPSSLVRRQARPPTA